MKKNLFILGSVAVALASCSNEEVMEMNNSDAIDFRVAVGSRATEMTTDGLLSFNVTAITEDGANYFTDINFTKKGSIFSSADVYHWPGNSKVDFFAYAPETGVGTVTITKDAKQFADFTPEGKISQQVDFITSHAQGSKATDEAGVALDFNHMLSQIEIQAKNDNEGYVYKVKGVRIANAMSKATMTYTGGKWNWGEGSDRAIYGVTYSDPLTLGSKEQSLMGKSGNAMLIPQSLAKWTSNDAVDAQGFYISVLVQISTKQGYQVFPETAETYGWVAVAVDATWEAGKHYTYALNFSNGAGFVAPDQSSIKPGESGNGGEGGGENGNIQDDGDDVSDTVDETIPDGPSNVESGSEGGESGEGGETPKPGLNILGGPIQFTATVSGWTPVTNTPDM